MLRTQASFAVVLFSTVAKQAALRMLQLEHLQMVILYRTAPISRDDRRTIRFAYVAPIRS
jgi:hypothetical protein